MMSTTINKQGTYVYDGSEVVLTGRRATRQVEQRRQKTGVVNVEILVEIHPLSDPSAWVRWVRLSELYTITTEELHDNK